MQIINRKINKLFIYVKNEKKPKKQINKLIFVLIGITLSVFMRE